MYKAIKNTLCNKNVLLATDLSFLGLNMLLKFTNVSVICSCFSMQCLVFTIYHTTIL